jgi:hypothetical protein
MRRILLILAALGVLLALGAAPAVASARSVMLAPPAPPASGTCTTGTIGSYPAVSCFNKTWHCTGHQAYTQVNIKIVDPPARTDGFHIDSGCGGNIRISCTTNNADCGKVHSGSGSQARCPSSGELTVGGVKVSCPAGRFVGCGPPRPVRVGEVVTHELVGPCLTIRGKILCLAKTIADVHQDGIQAMGGAFVLYSWLKVWCPTGNNGGNFFNSGKGAALGPYYVICDHCDLFENNAPFNIGPGSWHSGVRFSLLHDGKTPASPANCRRISADAVEPVDQANTCLTPKTKTAARTAARLVREEDLAISA